MNYYYTVLKLTKKKIVYITMKNIIHKKNRYLIIAVLHNHTL